MRDILELLYFIGLFTPLFSIVVLVVLFLICVVLPWTNRSRIRRLKAEMNELKNQLQQIFTFLKQEGVKLPLDIMNLWQQRQCAQPSSRNSIPDLVVEDTVLKQHITCSEKKAPNKQKEKVSFEQQFGASFSVWIGGIALALAGFFMIKYSIETGLLNETVRIVLGLIFGCGLLYAANWVRSKSHFANGTRIAQALSGAGIADLYFCIFAATSLYDLIPAFIGFAGMAIITATAVVLSIKHGMPIALLGLIGGFLTPAMVDSQNPQAPILFIYLYLVLTGLMLVIRKQCWWLMAIPTVLGAFSWVCLWLFGSNFIPSDTIWLGLFLIAVSVTVVITSEQQYNQGNVDITDLCKVRSVLNYLTLGSALLLTGIIASYAGFGLIEWGLFCILSLGGVGLAYFNQSLYGFVPWLSMAVNAVMLMVWNAPNTNAFALTISVFVVLYIASGYLLQSRSEKPLIFAGLVAAASIGYYFLGYYELQNTELVSGISLFWGILALVFAGFSAYALQNILREVPENHPQKQHLMAIYAGMGTAFLSIALSIELPREFLSVAFAAQLFAITWINTKVDVKALRYITGILACVFGFLLIPQVLIIIQILAYRTEIYGLPALSWPHQYTILSRLFLMTGVMKTSVQNGIHIVNWPIFQLGLPALFFMIGSCLLRKEKDDRLVRSLEVAAIALIGVMGYYLTRHAFHVDENILFVKARFIERSVITNILFIYGLVCLSIGRCFTRRAVSLSGLVLSGIAIFRICYFDFIVYNPLWSSQAIGTLPIFNALLLTYGLPILWTLRTIFELPYIGKTELSKYGYSLILLLSFALVSLNVRQMFHGTYLDSYETSNAEIYTYSIAWLLFGLALLFFGTLRKDKMIRVASLIVMLLTVGKVFLYDASELTGLFRVFSFSGLGVSLLSLSWFYTQFVFGKHHKV